MYKCDAINANTGTTIESGTAIIKDTPEPEVKRALDVLEERLSRTLEYLSILENKLVCVLSDPPIEKKLKEEGSILTCPLAINIDESFCRPLDNINSRLEELVDRLEI